MPTLPTRENMDCSRFVKNSSRGSWRGSSGHVSDDGYRTSKRSPTSVPFVRSLAMLGEVVTVDGREAPHGEQSSKVRLLPADAFVRSLALPAATAGAVLKRGRTTSDGEQVVFRPAASEQPNTDQPRPHFPIIGFVAGTPILTGGGCPG